MSSGNVTDGPPRVYLAGPDVFLEKPQNLAERKKEMCSQLGFSGVFPLDESVGEAGTRRATGLRISLANEQLIRSCQLVVAHITPFRGASADVGTVYEMGYAHGLGKVVFAYSNVISRLHERTRAALGPEVQRAPNGRLHDGRGMSIEEFDMVDNLMIEGCVEASGGVLVVEQAPNDELFTYLGAFAKCLQHARRRFMSPSLD